MSDIYEGKGKEEEDWVERILDYSAVPSKFQPGSWGVLEPKSPVKEFLYLQEWICISTPTVLNYCLQVVYRKHDIGTHTVVDPEGQQLGLSVARLCGHHTT